MSNISGLFEEKVAELADDGMRLSIRYFLNCLIVDSTMNKNGLSASDITRFCEMTPCGEELMSLYQKFKVSFEDGNPDFVKFACHIIDKPLPDYF